MVRGPTPPAKPSSSGGWFLVILIIVVLVMVGQCSDKKDAAAAENVSMTDMNAADAATSAPTVSPPATPSGGVQPLDAKTVAQGMGEERSVMAAQGLSGAMIFSQNCYDALGRAFTWSKLDECGAFDALAAARLTDDDAALHEKEAAYFDGETVAGRYLEAATGAGEEAGEADQRWARLQSKTKPSKPAARSDIPEADAGNSDFPTAAEEVAADATRH